ncbi:MAG: aminoglycoside phosphotransferase family protein [Oscillospiraceae bacterium]|nr:aminoglycoside phosphotransferase family protein [Oscillospiraceae bacterium]
MFSFDDIKNICDNFVLQGEFTDFSVIKNGHINISFKINYSDNRSYLLQQINSNVFQNTEVLMNNIDKVTSFLRNKRSKMTSLFCYPTLSGKKYYIDDSGKVWRVYNYIDNSVCYNIINSPELFYKTGAAFGEFQKLLADFPIDELGETIPDFHNTAKRYTTFLSSVAADKMNRADACKPEIEFVKNRADDTRILTDLISRGELPVRVTHNDTKLNNILFDADTSEPKCVVDLDTVMPGLSLYDFGDAIRSGASTAEEDETDLSKVSCDLSLYEAYVKGYLSSAGDSLTEKEIEYLPFSAKLLTLECGIRFLTDYLEGDVYFKTSYPEHNLVRCRTQFKLVEDMENKMDEMIRITNSAAFR